MTTPPPDPFATPRDEQGQPAERPSWDTSGTYGAPPQQGPSYGRQPGQWQPGQWPPGQEWQPGQWQPGQQFGQHVDQRYAHQPGRPGSAGPPWQGPTATGSQAIVALVCAIASWVVFPVLPAIAALLIARTARDQIARSGGRLTGNGMVTAAKVVAWANLVATLLVVLLIALGLLLFTATSSDLRFS